MQTAQLWNSRRLIWQAYEMNAAVAASSRHKLPMSERDMRLAQELLTASELPSELAELLDWCIQNQSNAEQENWIGCEFNPSI